MINLAHYKLIDYSQKIISLCAPLEIFNITYFNYIKVFQDGTRLFFGNHPAWIKHFFDNKYFLKANFSANTEVWDEDFYAWYALPNDGVLSVARNDFNIDNGITIVDRYHKFTELFLFASNRSNVQINNFYLNNLNLLRHFVNYFKDRLYGGERLEKSCVLSDGLSCGGCSNAVSIFLNQTKVYKYHLNYKGVDYSLSPQQYLCLKMLGEGLPLKLIAESLGIKAKTCQFYLDAVKDKLGCFNRIELLKFIRDTIKTYK